MNATVPSPSLSPTVPNTSGGLLIRNALLNFLAQAVPLAVGIVTTPFLIRALGTDRYGMLGLAWVVLGYFSVFDLGLGRAMTKYVAEFLAQGNRGRIQSLVWTAVTVQGAFGLLGALVLLAITPFLATRILSIPRELIGEATSVLYLLGIAVPLVLLSAAFSGVLEAAQRFDLVNAVRAPAMVLALLLSLLGAVLGLSLASIVGLILLARYVALLTLIGLALRVFPELIRFSTEFESLRRLFAYGGWVTVTSVVNPFLVYMDRLLVASLASVGALAYYTAPYDAVTKLWIIPASLTMTLFPAFSSLQGIGDRERLGMLFSRSVKYVLLALGPIVFVLVLFAREILRLWLGSEFAAQSTLALQILSWGILINSLAHVPYSLLQGIGRPDLTAKFHLAELPIYASLAWLLVGRWGISGAAAAWTARVALDALLLFAASFVVCRFSPRIFVGYRVASSVLALVLLLGVSFGLKMWVSSLPLAAQSLSFLTLLVLFGGIVWVGLMDGVDRGAVFKMVKS